MPDNTEPAALIRALDAVGVDFSIPEPVLRDFLGNAEFTPYPALSAGLLKLLESRMLRRPVFLDVIVFNYEHSPGEPSPRRIEDVDFGVLEGAVLEGFNNRYAEQNVSFQTVLKPLDAPQPPVQTLALVVEGTKKVENGITLVDTDNPRIEVGTKLISVPAQPNNVTVPQEIVRIGNGWRFTNGDVELSVSNGEAEAGLRPIRAGSLSEGANAWPTTVGTFSGATGADVRLQARIRVGYRPVDVKLLVHGRKGFAANTAEKARIALDPDVLLVPIEVARFFSDAIPVQQISAASQMALWDQVPIMSPTTNLKSTDGGTGELQFAERAWDHWPVPDNEGLYTHLGWVSPDSIWGKAGIRFRLVNYIDIKTDNEHAAPGPAPGVVTNATLRANNATLNDHPQHIKDKPVVKVIFMHRIAPPDAPQIGEALVGSSCIGISAGASDRFATIAHEIGHLITGSGSHSTELNNVMNDPGPGTNITDAQIALARTWAKQFADFWVH
ncbi:hypothetical protein [Nocardia altamirensis]|uniref:hypothetical protein n=1 Tax=Nocardia altamirensis TaxID=472158 RepID=UPI00084071BA|nr:hypothetical protein [Nocardia altamirensis]